MMRYGSVCSGIEAATVAWHPLGWRPAFFSEIDPFPRAVLAHHYPEVPLHGDFTTIQEGQYRPIDLLVGGTPCQSFSVAGLRGGMDDDRGNLALEFLRLARRLRPRWVAWENVPGVLSSAGGRDFGSILGGLVELGYGFSYRVLDAQFVRVDNFARAVPQRRRRVFVVGYLGDWRRATAVLFEPGSMSRDPAPSRKAREDLATDVAPCLRAGGNATGGDRPYGTDVDTCDSLIPIAFDTTQITSKANRSAPQPGGPCHPLTAVGHPPATALSIMPQNSGKDFKARPVDVAQPVMAGGPVGGNQGGDYVQTGWAVRRLTPRECERLQGFPDDYTLIPHRKGMAADGPRYKALGNSMAVNVMRWIGQRIQMVETLTAIENAA